MPAEAVTKVSEDQVIVEPERTERADGPAPFDTKVRPPSAEGRSNDDHASPPIFGNAESAVDPRNGIYARFPSGR